MRQVTLSFFLAYFLVVSSFALAQRGMRTQKRDAPAGEQRVALVIGNSAYKRISRLKNPANDAQAMTRVLKQSGFQVTTLIDDDRRGMLRAIERFGKKLRNGGVGLFYFAGHGVQARGRNYLIPLAARVEDVPDLEYEAVDAGRVLGKMESAQNRLNIVILDACRNNPYGGAFRSVRNGLAQINAPSGSLVAYATGPGKVAADGDGKNGLYTGQLVRHLRTPGLKIEEVFKRVRRDVMHLSGGTQTPWENTSITGDFYFAMASIDTSAPVTAAVPKGPGKSNFNLKDIGKAVRQEEASRKAWAAKQGEMKGAFEKVESFDRRDISPNLKASAWQRFLSAFSEKNPYTNEDVTLRNQAQNRIAHWQGEQRRLEEDRKRQAGERPGRQQAALTPLSGGITWRDPVTGMEFVRVPGGSFEMGCHSSAGNCNKNEKQVRKVKLTGFWMGKYEVTQGQWKRIMGDNPSKFEKGDNYPVERVEWNEVQEFIQKFNSQSSAKFRLPSEAQWEYACRAGGKKVMYGTENGRISPASANYQRNNRGTTPVGRYKANGLGLHDMAGNVWEWVQDTYTGNYSNVGGDNPIYEGSGSLRVYRGGSWGSKSRYLRCSYRFDASPSTSRHTLGFRLLRD